jgi:hypothetical protein
MFKKKPVLKYESAIGIYPNIMTPAKNHVPEWYKKIPKWKNKEMFTMEKGFNITVKHCMPFLDSLTIGYVILLPNDLYVKNNNGAPFITWNNAPFGPTVREEPADLKLVPTGCNPTEFVWQLAVATTIPIGFSMLLTHPLNRHDLPFTTLSGVIDGGLITNPTGKIPFYIKQGFEGIIPQGTPIAQIIPFRQENWSSEIDKGLAEEGLKTGDKSLSLIYGWYKKTFWTKKNYY